MHKNGGFHCYDLGEEIAPGFHVGDRIRYDGDLCWVSNIKGTSKDDPSHFVFTDDDPNKLLEKDPNDLCHGDYVYDLSLVTLVECFFDPVTEEEIAALFGLTLLEMNQKNG